VIEASGRIEVASPTSSVISGGRLIERGASAGVSGRKRGDVLGQRKKGVGNGVKTQINFAKYNTRQGAETSLRWEASEVNPRKGNGTMLQSVRSLVRECQKGKRGERDQ